jgi:hypothetical protein
MSEMARGKPKPTGEDCVGVIYGIDLKGDLICVSVYGKGNALRLSGPRGSHPIPLSNVWRGMDGWKDEAATIWNIGDLIGFSPLVVETEYVRGRIDALGEKAAGIKASLEPKPKRRT